MSLRTYGDKPMSFQLEENGEYFYVGSEVSKSANTLFTNFLPSARNAEIDLYCGVENSYLFL